jgi:hypothetical protein
MHPNSELINALVKGKVELVFLKADGSSREMIATLAETMLPGTNQATSKTSSKYNQAAQAVWDTELKAWRSFRWDRLQTWCVIK